MYALSDENRLHLMRLAVMIVCGGTAILPFTVPPTSPAARAQVSKRNTAISIPDIPGKLEFPSINVERDPFVTDPTVPAAQPGVASSVNRYDTGDEIGIVLPPNEGARGVPSPSGSNITVPIVRGIVLGDSPQALLEFNGGIKVVSVGDLIGGETVRSIDANGVVLASGLRLRIMRASI